MPGWRIRSRKYQPSCQELIRVIFHFLSNLQDVFCKLVSGIWLQQRQDFWLIKIIIQACIYCGEYRLVCHPLLQKLNCNYFLRVKSSTESFPYATRWFSLFVFPPLGFWFDLWNLIWLELLVDWFYLCSFYKYHWLSLRFPQSHFIRLIICYIVVINHIFSYNCLCLSFELETVTC